jgi:hypothetical protein
MEARAVFEGTAKLIPDVLWRQLDVEYGGVDRSAPHEAHEGRQREAGAHHVRAEEVAKPMRVGLHDFGLAAVMLE